MQEAPVPHSAIGSLAYTVAMLLSGSAGTGILLHLLNRRRVNSESEANAVKAKAEARHLESEIIDRAYDRIDDLHAIIDELRAQQDKDRLELLRMSRLEFEFQEQRRQLAQQMIELQLQDKQIKKMKGLIDAKGLKLSDLDEPQS